MMQITYVETTAPVFRFMRTQLFQEFLHSQEFLIRAHIADPRTPIRATPIWDYLTSQAHLGQARRGNVSRTMR